MKFKQFLNLFLITVLLFLSSCAQPKPAIPTVTNPPTSVLSSSSVPRQTEPTLLSFVPTPTPTIQQSATPRPTWTATFTPVSPAEATATEAGLATQMVDWFPTPISHVEDCVMGSTEQWVTTGIEPIGFSMEVPIEWYDYGFKVVPGNLIEGAYFKAEYQRFVQHIAGIEGITLLVWKAEGRTPQEFQHQLGVWLAEQEPPLNDLNAFPFFTSTVNGQPASITYYPAQHWDQRITSTQIVDIHVKLGEYFFNIRYQPHENHDPTEILRHMLSSMRLEGVEGGETVISDVVLCQTRLNACLARCYAE